jgi:hypothetical protein
MLYNESKHNNILALVGKANKLWIDIEFFETSFSEIYHGKGKKTQFVL